MKIKLFSKNNTIDKVFYNAANKYLNRKFLAHPYNNNKIISYTYRDTKALITKFSNILLTSGISSNDRVAVMVGNIPEYFIIKLSLNLYGISIVPLNDELKKNELKYILEHSKPKIIITNKNNLKQFKTCTYIKYKNSGLCILDNLNLIWIKIPKLRHTCIKVLPSSEASLLYTSGTTGKPKGCILSHEYEINSGIGYINKKGLISIRETKEKIYNCLPVHHVNAGVLSFYAILLTGNCQIQAKRFSASLFWQHIKKNKATIFHYLGIMAPLLLKNKKSNYEVNNRLRLGVGAGIEPQLHKVFENRFGIPMVELWGMTEMVRCIYDNYKTRKVGKRCIGKPDKSLQTKVVNANGHKVINKPGELLIRHNRTEPRKGFFLGYLNDKEATEEIWKDNWFHTGDIVKKDSKGYLYFVDRKKNIIRRAGENISAAEVEAYLLSIPYIINCAVIPIPHNIYEEEVMAFITLKDNKIITKDKAIKIMKVLKEKLTYFKLPYFIQFTKHIPQTSTQKIIKHELYKIINQKDEKNFFDVSYLKKK